MKGQKTGGRTKGTPNRQTELNAAVGKSLQRDGIIPLLHYYMFGGEIPPQLNEGRLIERLDRLPDREALAFIERLMQYAVPKIQSATIGLTAEECRKTIEDTLHDLMGKD